jgi:hypothetical protein
MRPQGTPKHRREENKMDIEEVGWGHGLDLSGLGEVQVADTCECGNEHSDSIKWNFLTSREPVSFSRTPLQGVSE